MAVPLGRRTVAINLSESGHDGPWWAMISPSSLLDQGPIYTRDTFVYFHHKCSRKGFRSKSKSALEKKEVKYVKVISNLGVHRRPRHGGLYEPGRISYQQATDSDTAVTRAQFEMNCPSAAGQVLSQEVTQPALQGPIVQGEERGLFTIGVAGCDQRRVYQVLCPMGGTIARRLKVACSEQNSSDGFRFPVSGFGVEQIRRGSRRSRCAIRCTSATGTQCRATLYSLKTRQSPHATGERKITN